MADAHPTVDFAIVDTGAHALEIVASPSAAHVAGAIERAVGATLPGVPLTIVPIAGGTLFQAAPDRWRIATSSDAVAGRLLAAFRGHPDISAFDVTHERRSIHVKGGGARELLARCTTLDLRGTRPGSVLQSRLGDVRATYLFLPGDPATVEVQIARSHCDYALAWLGSIAEQLGANAKTIGGV
jgi:heterotetrameric sarcosine oxidase gamma subunit